MSMPNTSAAVVPKPTSYEYGEAYQLEQVEKHRHRSENHWKPRLALAHELVDDYVLPRLGARPPSEVMTLDIGCSIGTMAIEMALRGFKSYGVDFDRSALRIARQLAAEEHVSVEFFEGDVSEWRSECPRSIDVAICFDIFEHLHDDELGALLQSIRRQLSPRGSLVFFTFPLQYDYLFFSRDLMHWPLLPFRWLSPVRFERVVRAYASLLDAGLLLTTGQSYKERIKKLSHCNPTTKPRLTEVLQRAGYSVGFIATRNIYPFKPHVLRRFGAQPVAHRNLFGVAYPRGTAE
jgi:2-polyprenyl-3-methyl-5-hydroxy-6-metoxy-1,4-benzoquinol methylase